MENPLEQRVKDLERQLADLKNVVAKLSAQKPTEQTAPARPIPKEKPFITPPKSRFRKEGPPKTQEEQTQNSKKWLGRLGIGLLLFGAVILFKYSIDEGWITPLVRVLFGLGLGIALFVFGLRLYDKNKMLSRLLLGGGIGTYYITIFAAFQLYGLISHSLAFVFMALVTVAAFLLAIRQDEPVLSIIGVLGGLLTPFLLYTGESNIPGLATYTVLLIMGASFTYMKRGWRALLWVATWGAWVVWAIAIYNLPDSIVGYLMEKWSIQIGILISWLAFWALPVYREFLQIKNPLKWPSPNLDILEKRVSRQISDLARRHLYLLTLSIPLVGLTLVPVIWDFSQETAGWINLVVSLIYFALFLIYRTHEKLNVLFFVHGLVATLILTWAFLLIFDGNTLFFVLAMESWILFLIAHKIADPKMEKVSQLFIGIMGLALLIRVFSLNANLPYLFNIRALVDLTFMLILVHAGYKQWPEGKSLLFFAILHAAIMGWLLRELGGFENGQAFVTAGWAILGLTVFIHGLRKLKFELRYMGALTIFIVVGKLFIIDLAELETIWRIVLFISFGVVLLFVSNYIGKMITPKKDEHELEK